MKKYHVFWKTGHVGNLNFGLETSLSLYLLRMCKNLGSDENVHACIINIIMSSNRMGSVNL